MRLSIVCFKAACNYEYGQSIERENLFALNTQYSILNSDQCSSYWLKLGSARSAKRVNSDWKASFTVPVGP